MKPATPKTGPSPSTQFRKAVFGGSLDTTEISHPSRVSKAAKSIRTLLVGWLLIFVADIQAASPPQTKPNIIFLLTDDLGYGDIKSFGGGRCQISTPGFDRLAAEGMRFTDANTVCSWCTPSRLSIMTGRYSWRFPKPKSDGPWGFINPRLSPQTFTLARLLERAGYRSGYFGKWHLGTSIATSDGRNQGPTNVDYSPPLRFGPNDCGFAESFILPGSLDMFPYAFVKNHRWVGPVDAIKGCTAFGRMGPAERDFRFEECLDRITTEAESFVAKAATGDATRPFFLYLALTGPHTPLSPGQGFAGRSRLGLYGDMVMETDHCVVRILSALKAHGLERNTLVIATSDNGPAPYAGRAAKATRGQLHELEKDGHFAAGPWRGTKATVYDGGTRVPFVVCWPGVVEPGRLCNQLVSPMDLMSTFAEICGVELEHDQGADSVSFLPLLKNPSGRAVRSSLVTESSHAFTIRADGWKLCLTPGQGTQTDTCDLPLDDEVWRKVIRQFGRKPNRSEIVAAPFVQLFDLSQDPAEATDLAAKRPEKVKELYKHLNTLVENGRSTSGPKLTNDTSFDPWVRMPEFVVAP